MPSVSRSHRYSSAFVNVRVRTEDDYGKECPICMRGWCVDDMCERSCIQTRCCLQFACSKCIIKISQRCACEDDCKQVVFMCPFCRSISKTESIALFLSTKRTCKKCKDSDLKQSPSPEFDDQIEEESDEI